MSATRRIALGLLTLWPLVYIVFFLVNVGVATVRGGGEPDDHLLVSRPLIFALHVVTAAVLLALLFVYLRHAYRSAELVGDRRQFWINALWRGNVFVMPIYWWVFLGPKRRRSPKMHGQ